MLLHIYMHLFPYISDKKEVVVTAEEFILKLNATFSNTFSGG